MPNPAAWVYVCWPMAHGVVRPATNTLTSDGVGTATLQAVAIAKANARLDGAPVQLAPVTPARQVSWKTPIKKNVNEFRKARLQMAFSWTK